MQHVAVCWSLMCCPCEGDSRQRQRIELGRCSTAMCGDAGEGAGPATLQHSRTRSPLSCQSAAGLEQICCSHAQLPKLRVLSFFNTTGVAAWLTSLLVMPAKRTLREGA